MRSESGGPVRTEANPYTSQELAAMPTLAQGQAEDLKVDHDDYHDPIRWWLSRCGPEDGETHRVCCERLIHGKWTVTGEFEPYAS